jgi:RimJ/RimL family protein N-acetyltransferase
MKVEPVTLEGRHVRLEPVRTDHLDALWAAGDANTYPELWRYIPFPMRTREDLRALIELGAASVAPFRLVFATVDRESGEAVGSTAFLNVDEGNRRLEIGSTWVTPAKQRSAVNTEAKYLQLSHCRTASTSSSALASSSRPMHATSSRAPPSSGSVPPRKACCASTC